ncbi:MAG: hypothetical protein IKD73_10495 [Selenomonadaceae bacterium]|nr:hypothetical protein [Selenomonadaceae bacterium]
MTEQEQINSEVQMKLALQDAKFNAFVEEMRDFKDEMRQQNQMRAEEIRDLRNEIRIGLDGMGKHVRNLAITSMAAIGAMVVTVIISLLKN